MGRLFYTESGRMLLHANEEITRWRWARKQLRLPQAAAGKEANLWMCLCAYPESSEPLNVRVNGRRVAMLAPERNAGAWQWRRVHLATGMLRKGDNEIVLSCEGRAMNAWMLGIEPGHRSPASALSTDRGTHWRNDNMGASGVLRGEYLVRLHVDAPAVRENKPPLIVYENPRHPRVRELLDLIPARFRNVRDAWKQVLALRSWVARAWTYEAFGHHYSPWDPATVLAWTRGEWGHGRAQPIAMCVHYGAVFAALAATLGHTSRGLAITEDIDGPNGHFMTEIWDRDLSKWIAHDPNFDLHYENGEPLSGVELADAARDGAINASVMRRGGGYTSACPRLNGLLNDKLATGKSFAAVGVWRLNDFVSNPASAPPNHGSVVYGETDFVWYTPHLGSSDESIMQMFPWRTVDHDYFLHPPPKTKRGGGS